MRMTGKIALVTGAGSGIGRATALRLAAEGARVACVDLVGSAAQETARTIEKAGGTAWAAPVDVTDEAAAARIVSECAARLGGLTTLVNSAGVRPATGDKAPPPDEWRRVVDVNLTGTYFMSRAAAPAMEATGNGSITNLASIFGLVGGSLAPSYAASKGAVVNLTRQMALQWAPRLRVNCVCPAVIETPMTAELRANPTWSEAVLQRYPMKRFGRPEEVAAAILFLASDDAGYVTGVALPVDGGYTAA
jgi:NAD(P)-dependent dehydrogenase (short-subunit alcohol dehydrogenase family)